MNSTKWIDGADFHQVGDVGFLVEHSNPYDRTQRFSLNDRPAHTNCSHKPRLYGWCGSWNNTSTFAHGLHRVERVAQNGRVLVKHVSSLELDAQLEKLGFPELGTTHA